MRPWFAIFAGGVAGALARSGLAEAIPPAAGQWPWATFAANTLGCLLLGAVLIATSPGSGRRSLLGPGLCGALTTFSTFQLELVELLRDGDGALALAFAVASLAAGLVAVEAGRRLAGARTPASPAEEPER